MRSATLLRLLAVLSSLSTPAAAQAPDSVVAVLRARIETIRAAGGATVQGAPLLSLDALPSFYARRGYRPAWGDPTRLAGLLEAIHASVEDGLTPADYLLAPLLHLVPAATAPRAPAGLRADLDLLATEALIRLASSLRSGKVRPEALDSGWNISPATSAEQAAPTLESLVASDSLPAALAALAPRSPLYLRLRQELARYRAVDSAGGWPTIAPGPNLAVGMEDPRVPSLRLRLAATGDLPPVAAAVPGDHYDRNLATGLAHFQARNGLAPDGVLGPRSIGELNVPPVARIRMLRVNLERARWVLPGLGRTFVAVNIPAFEAYYVRNDSLAWSGKAVVGQPYLETPQFQARMTSLVLNPTWTVPAQILTDEVLPAIRRNVAYLARNDMVVRDRDGEAVDPATIDWDRYDVGRTFPYLIVQEPGDKNPLGRVKFVFPNAWAVYLHDTSEPGLFRRSRRSFSHGCIRIQHPMVLASMLLGDSTWTAAALDSVVALGRETTVPLPEPVSVLVLYWTAWADQEGAVHFRPDLYGRDGPLLQALDAPYASHPRSP